MSELSSSPLPTSSIKNVGVPPNARVESPNLPRTAKQDAESKPYEPFSSGADALEIVTDDDLTFHIRRLESGTNSGLILIVDNNRLDAISKVSVTVYSAQSFDAYHKDFRSNMGFKATRIIDTEIIHPSSSSRPLWIVRKDINYSHLLAGDDNTHQMTWPENDKSEDQRWQLSLGITAETVAVNASERPKVFPTQKMKLVALWVKASNHFEIGGASALTTSNDTEAVLPWGPPTQRPNGIVYARYDKPGQAGAWITATVRQWEIGGKQAYSFETVTGDKLTGEEFMGTKDEVIARFFDFHRTMLKDGYKRMNFTPGPDPEFSVLQ